MRASLRLMQIFFGLALVVFGLNQFFSLFPVPEKQGFAFEFLNTLHQTHYIFPLIGGIMITTGILLILNRWVAFGMLMLLPVSINIFAFHLFHDWQGLVPALVIFIFNCSLILIRREQFKALF
jgi:putative oxidoreductase